MLSQEIKDPWFCQSVLTERSCGHLWLVIYKRDDILTPLIYSLLVCKALTVTKSISWGNIWIFIINVEIFKGQTAELWRRWVDLAGEYKYIFFPSAALSLNSTTNAVCVCLYVCVADEVPGSAVLVFDIELVELEEGLPEGYMFIWNDDVSPDLFTEMDTDKNAEVEPSEVCDTNLLLL